MIKLFFGLTALFFFIFICCCAVQSYDSIALWFVLSLLSLIIAVIMTIYRATKATVRFAGEVVDFACDLVVAVVAGVIDLFTIKDQVRQKVPSALKIKIMEKKKSAVRVGIFGEQDKPICPMDIEGDGVQDNLYVGQTIYLNN